MIFQNAMQTQQNVPARSDAPCTHCGRATVCESWCESVNTCVQYAYDIVLHPTHLTFGDRLILHALGVRWTVPRSYPKSQKNG
jgi:hypothetical protein